ncbi:hypothetical protein [Saccharicrinis sp. GN24d3]|uniref:hypothetical protein n=1 Tax=Saccharicrinis sp. GN24d3 TaxID=3458416 RepID=UPI0040356DCA
MAEPISLPKGYKRLGAFAIDEDSVFITQAALDAYLAGGSSYAGQVVALVLDAQNEAQIFKVNKDKTLGNIGSVDITVDVNPTDNSENPVSSDGVFKALNSEVVPFSSVIRFDRKKASQHTQDSDIHFTLDSEGHISDKEIFHELTGNGLNTLSIDKDAFNVFGELDNADINHIFMWYSPFNKPYAIIKQFNKEVAGNVPPIAISPAITADPLQVNFEANISYVYSDTEGDAEDKTSLGTSYKLKRYDSLLEAQDDVNGIIVATGATYGTTQKYTFVTEDTNRYFIVEITPKALSGTRVGSVYKSPVAGPVSGEFSIDSLGTNKLKGYYTDPNEPTNVVLDTNAPVSVEQWLDKSGNNNHLINNTKAQQPLINMSAMQFDGVDDLLSVIVALSGAYEFYFVVTLDTPNDNARLMDTAGTSRSILQNRGVYSYVTATRVDYPGGSPSADTKVLYQLSIDGADSYLKTRSEQFNTGELGAFDISTLHIGNRADGSLGTEGKIFDIVILDKSEATQEDIDNVRNALLLKHFQ